METGPDGDLYVVSLTNGAIYRIFATGITVDLDNTVVTDGSRGQVTGTFTCEAGDVVLLELELTQDGAGAVGRQRANCTGEQQTLRINFATTGAALSDGDGQACVTMSAAAPRARTPDQSGELCQPVTIDVRS